MPAPADQLQCSGPSAHLSWAGRQKLRHPALEGLVPAVHLEDGACSSAIGWAIKY